MTKRKTTSWVSLVGGAVGVLTLLGILFGNVMAFGKAQAETEQVKKDVAGLKDKVAHDEESLTDTKSDQKLIQKDVQVIRDNMAEQKVLLSQVLDVVTKRR